MMHFALFAVLLAAPATAPSEAPAPAAVSAPESAATAASGEPALGDDASEPKALFDTAVEAFREGRYADAIPALETLTAAGYRSSDTGPALRSSYERVHGIDGTIAFLEDKIRTHPKDHVAHTSLGVFYLVVGRKDEAQKSLAHALTLAPRDLDAQLNLAYWYAQVGQPTAAVKEFEAIVNVAPENDRALRHLCEVLASRSNEPDRALPYCERLVALDQTNEANAVALGLVRMQLGDLEGAESAFRTVADANPKAIQARTMLANTRLHRGALEEAEKDFEAVLALAPKYPDARMGLARTYQARKEHGKALDLYKALYAEQGGGLLLGALAKAYLQKYFYLIIFGLMLAMGLLLWKYLNVRAPEPPTRPAAAH